MDVSSADLTVSATVQRLTVFVVFKFVNRVMVSGCGCLSSVSIISMYA